MGLFGGSSSSQQVTNETTAASNGSLAAANGAQINVLDGGAIAQAFGATNSAVNSAFNFGDKNLDLVSHINDTAIAALSQSFADTSKMLSASTAQIIGKVSVDSGERVQQLVQMVAWVAGAIAVVWMFKR